MLLCQDWHDNRSHLIKIFLRFTHTLYAHPKVRSCASACARCAGAFTGELLLLVRYVNSNTFLPLLLSAVGILFLFASCWVDSFSLASRVASIFFVCPWTTRPACFLLLTYHTCVFCYIGIHDGYPAFILQKATFWTDRGSRCWCHLTGKTAHNMLSLALGHTFNLLDRCLNFLYWITIIMIVRC